MSRQNKIARKVREARVWSATRVERRAEAKCREQEQKDLVARQEAARKEAK